MNTDKIYAESLINEYAPKEASKVVALKKLDQKAKLPATIFTYSLGIFASLVIGVGMCLSMGIIGNGTTVLKGIGIIIGLNGFALAGINYPIYKKIMKANKEKYAFEIVEIAKKIAEEN